MILKIVSNFKFSYLVETSLLVIVLSDLCANSDKNFLRNPGRKIKQIRGFIAKKRF